MKKLRYIAFQVLFAAVIWVSCNWSLKIHQGYKPFGCVSRKAETTLGIKKAHMPPGPDCDPCCSCNGKCCSIWQCIFWVCPDNVCCFDCLLYTSPSPRDGLLSRM